ncbi:MAG: toprim domain-containing protein, partial [Thermodesulfovibrionales bacterium]
NRGINQDVINTYKIGYSTPEIDSLFKYLSQKGFSEEDILRSRLVHKDGEKRWDFFRDRIMFPIYDKDGQVIAFGGRRLAESNNIPKYINSPDTDIFKKGNSIFGLHQAKNAIINKGYAIIVEGYIDVIMCFQHGFENVVAPLGTALTGQQLERIKRYTQNLLLIFDGDTAGISATKRAIELSMSKSFNTKIVLLPKNDDPDSILRRDGHSGLKALFSRALTPVSFYFRLFGKTNKAKCVRDLLNIVMLNNDILQREEHIKQITEISGINELAIRQEAENIIKKISKRLEKKVQEGHDNLSSDNTIDEYAIRMLLDAPPNIRKTVCNIDLESLRKCTTLRLLSKINKYRDLEGNELFDKILAESDDEERAFLTRLGCKTSQIQEITESALSECIKNMLLKIIDSQMKESTLSGNLNMTNLLLEKKRRLSTQITDGY